MTRERPSKRETAYDRWGKRALDLALAVPALICLSPLMLAVLIVIRWQLGGPAIFRQQRAGYLGRPFTVYKFRSMRDAYDANGRPLPDAQRLTRLGRLLRSLSLDELPQLWNILRGEMSFVGPRPLLTQYLDRYDAHQARRHEVVPGITGWAQINGRNTIDWNEKFNLDVWYVDHRNLVLDISILWRTVVNVVGRRGISASDHATMPEFWGNQSTQQESSS